MYLFPAIDLIDGKAVRLLRGDYAQMTVYNDDPLAVAKDFEAQGAKYIHMVDLEGAKNGGTPNLSTVQKVAENTGLFVEIGGGIRSMDTVKAYLDAGIDRVILGTAAVEDEAFLKEAVDTYGEKIAVGADIRDGYVSIKGWLEQSLKEKYDMNITASGGVSSMEDVEALAAMDLYGAIIGKAYYTGDIILSDAIRAAGPQE